MALLPGSSRSWAFIVVLESGARSLCVRSALSRKYSLILIVEGRPLFAIFRLPQVPLGIIVEIVYIPIPTWFRRVGFAQEGRVKAEEFLQMHHGDVPVKVRGLQAVLAYEDGGVLDALRHEVVLDLLTCISDLLDAALFVDLELLVETGCVGRGLCFA